MPEPKDLTILSLCDRTQVALEPWKQAGYNTIAIDLQGDPPTDVLRYIPPLNLNYHLVMAFPPCTHVAVSGAPWFQRKGLPKLMEALEVLDACKRICEASGARWFIENPVSTFSSYWRKPDYTFDPYQYAPSNTISPEDDASTKKTCLWTSPDFVMPTARPWTGEISKTKLHHLPPSPMRGDLRSVTPRGFAYAVFEANRLPSLNNERASAVCAVPSL
jgi:hypothetical protein